MYVLLRSYDNYIDAHIAMGKLQEASISCYLLDELNVTITPFLSNAIDGIKLMVAGQQLERAASLLQQEIKS